MSLCTISTRLSIFDALSSIALHSIACALTASSRSCFDSPRRMSLLRSRVLSASFCANVENNSSFAIPSSCVGPDGESWRTRAFFVGDSDTCVCD
eukprot:112405-Rhodomonas_salina.1